MVVIKIIYILINYYALRFFIYYIFNLSQGSIGNNLSTYQRKD